MLNIKSQVPLAPLTTFQIGGSARYFVEASGEEEIREALEWARDNRMPFTILAGGSNVLINDAGFDGLVIKIMGAMGTIAPQGEVLTVEAGYNLLLLIRAGAERGLGGWEKLAGIPGTVGGAVRGNAGAFGTEMRDVVTQVHALNTDTLEVKDFDNKECDFAYRYSYFKSHPEWVILHTTFALKEVEATESKKLIEETIAEREKRHLQDVKAAGSYFVNPVAPQNIIDMFEQEKGIKSREGRVPAGWLIEKAGMKGASVGGAQASQQHPNYIINTGNATSADVFELAEQIKSAVEKQFGVQLQEEAVKV